MPQALPMFLILATLLPTFAYAAGRSVVVAEADAGQEVTLAPGDLLYVRLRARPGTGYRWEVRQADPAVLEAQGGVAFEQAPNAPPGNPATQVLRFRASAVGETELSLVYVRPWERDKAPAERFTIYTRVQ